MLLRPGARAEPDEWAAANRKYPASAGIPGPRNPYLTGYMVPFCRKVHAATHKRCVAVTAAQSGKALAIDTPIATPDGWKSMGELQVGDRVFGSRGDAVVIDRVSPVMFGHTCYEVEFDDGQVIVADAEHIWTVERTDCSGRRRRVVDMTTEAMDGEGVSSVQANGRNRFKFSVQVAGALDLPEADLPLDPYLLGAWLGDGNARCAAITVGNADLEAMKSLLHEAGVETSARPDRKCWRVAINLPGKKRKRGGLRSILSGLGVIGNKHVPASYLRASAPQRLALLQGLMDTDGTVDNGTVASFCACAKNEVLARNVVELAASLGYRPRIKRHKLGHWIVNIQCYREQSVFRMARKTEALRSEADANARPFRNSRRSIVAIRPAASVPVKCIGVVATDHLFLAGPTMIPTHNTDNILDIIGARLDQRPTPILYAGPSAEFVRDQFEPRLMDLLDQAETLKGKVARGKRMKKNLKVVAGVKVRLGSAGSSTSLKSDPFGLGIVDEYDEMMGNIKGQGDPLGLVEARGETYADFVTAVVSTPSIGVVETEVDPVNGLKLWKRTDPDQIASPIWKLWQDGTRHHFAWPCPCCGEYFVPRFENLHIGKGWTPAQARREAFVQCPKCGGVITDDDKPAMIEQGVQIAPGQTIEEARIGANEPDNSTWSCWTSGLCSPFVSFGERAEAYLDALQSGDPSKIQTIINSRFGECYNPAMNADAPAWETILSHALPYRRGEVPAGGLRILMGVDVQANCLYYTIRAFGGRGTSWLIDFGQLYGSTAEDGIWADLADLMLAPLAGGLHIEKCFIDAGFRPDKKEAGEYHKVYDFARRFNWMVVPCRGRDVQNPPYKVSQIEVKASGKKASFSIEVSWLSTDFFKSLMMARMKTPLGHPGAFYVFSDERSVMEPYARQVTSEVRIMEAGKPKWITRGENHWLDCEALVTAGAYTLNVQRIPEGVERALSEPPVSGAASSGADSSAREDAPAPSVQRAPVTSPAVAAASGGAGVRDRFASLGRRLNR